MGCCGGGLARVARSLCKREGVGVTCAGQGRLTEMMMSVSGASSVVGAPLAVRAPRRSVRQVVACKGGVNLNDMDSTTGRIDGDSLSGGYGSLSSNRVDKRSGPLSSKSIGDYPGNQKQFFENAAAPLVTPGALRVAIVALLGGGILGWSHVVTGAESVAGTHPVIPIAAGPQQPAQPGPNGRI